MKKLFFDTYEEVSRAGAEIIAQQIKEKKNSILGLATGSTPIGMYKELIKMYQAGEVDFSDVYSFNLDEYYRIKKDNVQSYDYFMKDNLFNHINIHKNNINIPNGDVENPLEECINYDKKIDEVGGIDLQVLGIGCNGHLGFNEPADVLSSATHLVNLTQNTIEVNARFFENINEVPTQAITLGMGHIMKAKKIILLVSGESKADIIKHLFDNEVTTQIPATLLKLHPDVTVIADKGAASKL